ncbi:glycosyltransferase family 4 protein [Paenibacillus piri]|uniref:glycosyltransferase family 4 protein n=1 Tax=Paenibacillus piri TaxID=2547395 RepID=UPI0014055D39|nr:glycosyltransferase family 4 protein [Paenibacillus piri]
MKRNEWAVNDGCRIVGFIASSLHSEKGLEHFVHMALSVCPEVQDVQFLIVGNAFDAYYMTYCQHIIGQSGYASRFHRMPFEARIELVYPAMDLVIIPNLIDEGFGMTALEGLVFGKGVIAYRAGGLEEILRTTGNADWLVEKGDSSLLTASVKGSKRLRSSEAWAQWT